MDKHKIRELLNRISDKVIFKKNGSIEIRHGYFYHHGYHVESFHDDLLKLMLNNGFVTEIIEEDDNFQVWPKDSYLKIVFNLTERTLNKVQE